MKITIKEHGILYDEDNMMECPECESVDFKTNEDGSYECEQCHCEFSVEN